MNEKAKTNRHKEIESDVKQIENQAKQIDALIEKNKNKISLIGNLRRAKQYLSFSSKLLQSMI